MCSPPPQLSGTQIRAESGNRSSLRKAAGLGSQILRSSLLPHRINLNYRHIAETAGAPGIPRGGRSENPKPEAPGAFNLGLGASPRSSPPLDRPRGMVRTRRVWAGSQPRVHWFRRPREVPRKGPRLQVRPFQPSRPWRLPHTRPHQALHPTPGPHPQLQAPPPPPQHCLQLLTSSPAPRMPSVAAAPVDCRNSGPARPRQDPP